MRNSRDTSIPYPNEFGTEIQSSILTAPYDPHRTKYNIREAAKEADRLGRPLSKEEMRKFAINV